MWIFNRVRPTRLLWSENSIVSTKPPTIILLNVRSLYFANVPYLNYTWSCYETTWVYMYTHIYNLTRVSWMWFVCMQLCVKSCWKFGRNSCRKGSKGFLFHNIHTILGPEDSYLNNLIHDSGFVNYTQSRSLHYCLGLGIFDQCWRLEELREKKTLKKSNWFVPMALPQREDCRIAPGWPMMISNNFLTISALPPAADKSQECVWTLKQVIVIIGWDQISVKLVQINCTTLPPTRILKVGTGNGN